MALLGLLLWFGASRPASDPGLTAEPFEMVFEPAPAALPDPAPVVPFDPSPPPAATVPDVPPPAAEPTLLPSEPTPLPEPVPAEPPVVAPMARPDPAVVTRRPRAPPPPRAASRPKTQQERAATAPDSHPVAAPAQPMLPAAVAPAPAPAAVAPIDPSWRRAVGAWLAEHKRYPDAARRRGEAGTVGVSFAVARDGRVGDAVVTSSSGSTILDDAVLALLSGRQVPAFSADMPQAEVRIAVRVVYTLEP